MSSRVRRSCICTHRARSKKFHACTKVVSVYYMRRVRDWSLCNCVCRSEMLSLYLYKNFDRKTSVDVCFDTSAINARGVAAAAAAAQPPSSSSSFSSSSSSSSSSNYLVYILCSHGSICGKFAAYLLEMHDVDPAWRRGYFRVGVINFIRRLWTRGSVHEDFWANADIQSVE